MNRRDVHRTLLGSVLVVASRGLGQPGRPPAVRIGDLARLREVWADLEFQFAGQPCLLVRVPGPQPHNPRILKASEQVYLTAYSRVCTHLGCTVPLPDRAQNIECGCHGSRFKADGSLLAGPANTPLRAVALEVRDGVVWAVGWLES
jgi:Rieske Fe-S protein